ncbi:MAG: TolC family protein [Sulfurimonas sp.]|nr:TolC family protein [Sulfurimonas sp.]
MKNSLSVALASLVLTSSMGHALPLYLSDAYEKALANNHGYRSKLLEKESSLYGQKQREAKLYPQVQLALNGGLHDYVQNYDEQKNVSEIYKSYSLSLTQPLYRPEIVESIDQGVLRKEGAEAETHKSSQELGIEVSKAYFELLFARKSLELAQANFDYYTIKYKMISEMLSHGLSNKMDLLDTQFYMDKSLIEINTAKKKERLSHRKLEDLLLSPISELPSFFPYDDVETSKTALQTDLSLSPDLKIAALSRQIAQKELSIRKYDHYPKVDLSLSRTENETNDAAMYKIDNRAYVQVTIPIYQGGATEAKVEEARLLHLSQIQKEAQTKQKFDFQLEELFEEQNVITQNIGILKNASTASKLNITAIETAQKSGLKSQTDLLEARSKLYKIEQDLLRQQIDFVINSLNILSLQGNIETETLKSFEKQFLR